MFTRQRVSVSLQLIVLLVAVTIGAWLLRGVLTLANFTTIYILVVLVLAIRCGTRIAVLGAVLSFLCINFFLVHPYYTFIVADPREVIDLVVFLFVAVIVGQLAARERRGAHEAQQRATEQETLYHLTRAVNQRATSEGVCEALLSTVRDDLGAVQVAVLPNSTADVAQDRAKHYVLLQADQQVYGTLAVGFDGPVNGDTLRLLNTCTSQAAMALRRIQLAEQARKSEQFEEADRLKTALLQAVSHDLRTPITIIKTSANNLRQLGERMSASERGELVEAIEQETDHLDGLIGNLLDLSRLQAGAVTLNSQSNSLEEVSGDVAAYAFQRLKQERIRLVFPDDYPLVRFDYGLMRQALTNLVDNALRYEPAESQIVLRGTLAGQEARLWVINHGENISDDMRARLMEPFFRGKSGHIGLGLAIAKGIVEAHHGRLWVEDTPGSGATFVIALPLESEQVDDA